MSNNHTACEKVVPIHELHNVLAVEPKRNDTFSIVCITATSEKLGHLKVLTINAESYRVLTANTCKKKKKKKNGPFSEGQNAYIEFVQNWYQSVRA